jgi:uncharacterized protein YjdB
MNLVLPERNSRLAAIAFILAALLAVSCSTSGSGDGDVAVAGVSLSKATTKILVDATEQLAASVSPSDATNKELDWESSDDAIATVTSSGLVTAHSTGNATITVVTADGGKTDHCSVTVPTGTIEVGVQ